MNHRTDMKFWKETSLHTMLTPPQNIVASTLGRFIFGRSSPVFNRITGNAQGFAVELPSPALLVDGWRVEISNENNYPVKLMVSSDTQLSTIPVGHSVFAVLGDASSETWCLSGTKPTSHDLTEILATTLNGTLTMTARSPSIVIFTGTATGYSARLPDHLTLVVGVKYTFVNTSSQTITIRNSAGTSLVVLAQSSNIEVVLQSAAGAWGILGGGFLQATGYQYYEDLTAASTTTTSFSTAAQFSTNVPLIIGGRYRIAVFFSWTNGVNNSDSRFRLTVDGAQVGPEVRVEKVETTNQSIWENGFAVYSGTGAVATIALQFASENNGVTTTVNEARFEIWRVS